MRQTSSRREQVTSRHLRLRIAELCSLGVVVAACLGVALYRVQARPIRHLPFS